MQFRKSLDAATQEKLKRCDQLLHDAQRLQVLERTELMDSPPEQAFDRLAILAAHLLHVPLTIVSLVGEKKQYFKAGFGLPPPFDTHREIPIDDSICRYTLAGEPIIVENASSDPFLMHHPVIRPWNIVAFLALPIVSEGGHVLGAFCAVDRTRRKWSQQEIEVMRELTASVTTEIDLRLQLTELRKQRELREHMVTTITHDLRTPVTAALIGVRRLEKKIADIPELKKTVRRVADCMARTDRMIGDLLDASRIAAGESMAVSCVDCDLRAVVQNTVEEMEYIHGTRFSLMTEAACSADCDANAMRRILENLLGNAVKYGQPETPITVRLNRQEATIALEVNNQGRPIPTDEQQLLFEPFQRAEATTASGQVGWGIGLSLVRSLTAAHGGQVTVKSSAEDGTTFTVRFPARNEAAHPSHEFLRSTQRKTRE